ncbi:MAG: hypothetical protein E7B34_26920, partial [Hafnia alvei]|nr:hypothetical protein [Hafnia alvei]
IFVLHLVNDDGRKGTYNLSECSEL